MNLHSMLHVFHNTFIINNVGSLWQWMGEGAKVGKKDKAGQSLLLSCCKPLVLFSFIFLKRTMLDIKSKNLRHSGPTICLVCWPWRVSFQPLSSVYGSPIMSQECSFKGLYPVPPLSLSSFLLIYSNRLLFCFIPLLISLENLHIYVLGVNKEEKETRVLRRCGTNQGFTGAFRSNLKPSKTTFLGSIYLPT